MKKKSPKDDSLEGKPMMEPPDDVTEIHSHDIITFNVGGIRFETLRRTLEANVHTRLSDSDFINSYYVEDRMEYFFDRDPDIFKSVLNYLRTGSLHLPSFICGPSAKLELEFWGVRQQKIEQCCWINYNEWNSTQEALKRLEHDRKVTTMLPLEAIEGESTFWKRWRPVVWRFMNRTNSSRGAKVFGIVSLLFVVVSIFSFLAETTEPFDHFIIKTSRELSPNNTKTSTMSTTDTLNTTSSSLTNVTLSGITTSSPSSEYIVKERTVRIKHPALQVVDLICLSYFIIEYVTRLVFSPKKLKHATSLLAVIDALAILPDLIEFIVYYARPDLKGDVDAVGYITIIRVIRVLRIFRLVRHSPGLWILIYTLRASFSELMLLVWFMGLGILLFSSLIYYVDDRDEFKSIPSGFWWTLITMTTVGYGDMYPKTTLGKIVGSCTAMAGVLMIGFTVPALVNNFMLYYRHVQFAMITEETEKLNEEQSKTASVSDKKSINGDIVTNKSPPEVKNNSKNVSESYL
ncbi:potassium voltage-gated channel protein Shaw-like isoform X2 [Ruditapes philippinarum]|uniref:potassium voltage-gated channel protein Shaw-like isoform X2 n=1 Tax=Ruditapes philippinarum TaxID=129788 RepID=UPI00295BACAD|nr:potassium voltage-gated channel protein Shaw-like isoform X2 [Ruditapes philippinarum]